MVERKKYIWILCLISVLLFFPTKIFAFEQANVKVPVHINLEGDFAEEKESFQIELKRLTKEAPMPKESFGDTYLLNLEETLTGDIEIKVETLGVYTYSIRQVPKQKAGWSYDETSYTCMIYATAAFDGNMEVTVFVENADKEKLPSVDFTNRFKAPLSDKEVPKEVKRKAKNPKTGDDNRQALYFVALSCSAIIVVLSAKRKKKL